MRIFEILLILSVFIFSILIYVKKDHSKLKAYTTTIIPLLFSLHLILEWYRWQMVICYFVAIILVLIPLLNKRINLFSLIILDFLLVISVILSVSFPVFILPAPTGNFQVGSKIFSLEDSERSEVFTDDLYDSRKIVIKAWYPSQVSNGITEKYWEKKEIGRALAEEEGFPHFFFDHISLVKTHTYNNSPLLISNEKYPVLIFSHGYLTHAGQSRILMEDLASHGYVVFSISHPYEAAASFFPDGSIVRYKEGINELTPQKIEKSEELWQLALASESKEEKRKYLQDLYALTYIVDSQGVGIWEEDTSFLIDCLENENVGFFNNRIDLSQIGVFGHSYGGSTAAEVCISDDRVKAGINFDGAPDGNLLKGKLLDKPFMVFTSELNRDPKRFDFVTDQYLNDTYLYYLPGSSHMDFSDFPYFTPLAKFLGAAGINNKEASQKKINEYTLAFFNKYLLDIDSQLIKTTTETERIDL